MRPFDQAPIVLADRCIAGVQANVQRCEEPVEQSVLMCTSLAPLIGYDTGAAIAKEAFAQGKTVRQVAIEKHALGESELNKALDPRQMTERH